MKTTMEYRSLGRSSLRVSAIGLGCVTFGREIDRDTAVGVADRAFERGITLFDTAEVYAQGASERVLGEWIRLRGLRDRIVVATKVHGVLTRERIISSTEASLGRLGIETIDLLQTHVWDAVTPLDETLAGLDAVVKQGKVRFIGCSNYTVAQVAQTLDRQAALGLGLMVSVQPGYSVVQRQIEGDLLPLCRQRGVGVLTFSPLGAGFLTGKYKKGEPVPETARFGVIPGHQAIYFKDECFRIAEALRAKAAQWGKPMHLLALAWVMAQPGPTSVLIGARSASQVDQAFEAMELGLSKQEIDELGRL